MEKLYQILLVEDDSTDAELLEIQLNKLDIDYDLQVISKQIELAHLLTEQLPDLIISDYNLPGFTGVDALKMVREKDPELPFILISGYIGEEQAVDAMRRGASDYVVKERLGRLGPAVVRELANHREREKSRQELKESQDRFRALVEHGNDVVFILSAEGNPFYISPSIKKVLGYTVNEGLNLDIFNVVHPDDREIVTSELGRAIENPGEPIQVKPARMKHKNGRWRWFGGTITNMLHEPTIGGIVDNFRDITDQIEAEKKLSNAKEKYESLIQSIDGIVWEAKADTFEFTFISDQVKEVLGYTPEQWLKEESFWEKHIHPDDRDEVVRYCQNQTKTGSNHTFEYRMKSSEGKYLWIRDVVTVVKNEGGQDFIRGLMLDISKTKALEKTLEKTYEYAQIGSWELDLVEDKLTWSPMIKKLHEVEPDYEPDLESGIEFYEEGWSRQQIKQAVERAIETGEPFDVEVKMITAKENRRWVRAIGNPDIVDGKCVRLFGSSQDITERKTQQEKLKKTEQKLRNIVENSTNMFYTHDLEGVLTYVSPQSNEFLGSSPEDAIQHWTEFITDHPVNKEGEKNTVKAIKTGKAQPPYELQLKKADGTLIWVEVNEAPLLQDGKTTAIVGSLTDITERKIFEQELISSNEKLNTAQRIAKLGYWELNLENDEIYWSDEVYRIWGRVPGEYKPNMEAFVDSIHPDDLDNVIESHEKAVQGEKEHDVVHRIFLPDGTLKWVHERGKLRRDTDDNSVSFEGTVQDVTAEKEAEQEKVDILESIKDAFFALDNNWTLTYWNREAEKVLGKSRKEIIGKNLWDEYADATELEFYTQYHKAVDEQKTVHFEEYYPTLDKWFEVSAYPSEKGLSVYFKNVTDRKKATIALEEAYKEKEMILDSIGDGFFTVDKNWIVTYWNRAAERMLETPKEVILGNNLWDIFADAVDLPSYTNYHRVMREGKPIDFEDYYEALQRWFDVSAYPSSDGISVFFKNITDRKESEEHIKKINERFEKVTEATNDAIWDYDVENEKLFWGKGFSSLFGYDLEKITPNFDFLISLIHPEDRERVVQKVNHFFQDPSNTNWFEEYRFRKGDGSYAYVIDRAIFIRDENGEVVRVVGAMTDLTRQKEYEESLKELNIELVQRAEELAASNAELEQFAYVASHDLQEPLRMVTSFLTQLENKYDNQLDEKAQQYIHFAVDGASRMRQIILDLLNYSRMGRGGYDKTMLSLDTLLKEILSLEHANIEESGAEITWDKLPSIIAAETPMKQVLKNLINNALKYQTPGTKPIIHISGQEEESHWKISVSDNGIGIREEFQDTIFTIFQRLHTRDQYSGTGIGLAVCRKIVEKHGGEIWVESAEGEGSTFHFTIAKSETYRIVQNE